MIAKNERISEDLSEFVILDNICALLKFLTIDLKKKIIVDIFCLFT